MSFGPDQKEVLLTERRAQFEALQRELKHRHESWDRIARPADALQELGRLREALRAPAPFGNMAAWLDGRGILMKAVERRGKAHADDWMAVARLQEKRLYVVVNTGYPHDEEECAAHEFFHFWQKKKTDFMRDADGEFRFPNAVITRILECDAYAKAGILKRARKHKNASNAELSARYVEKFIDTAKIRSAHFWPGYDHTSMNFDEFEHIHSSGWDAHIAAHPKLKPKSLLQLCVWPDGTEMKIEKDQLSDMQKALKASLARVCIRPYRHLAPAPKTRLAGRNVIVHFTPGDS